MMSEQIDLGFGKRPSLIDKNPAESWLKDFYRIGHAGAKGHAPANSIRSFELALTMGVDMIEFDVRPCRDGLVLLHDDDLWHISRRHDGMLASESTVAELKQFDLGEGEKIPTLSEALDFLHGRIPINVDLKAPGYELEVIETLRSKNMLNQALISSTYTESLLKIRQASSEVKTGFSYPAERFNVSRRTYLKPIVQLVLKILKRLLPLKIISLVSGAQANAVMLNYLVVTEYIVEIVQQLNGRVFVWTVDELEWMLDVHSMGVDGIASNYPELFARL